MAVSKPKKTAAGRKFQSIFPGVYVTTTIEGSYQNLRRFIREIETSEQFIVISAVELEPAEKEEKDDPTKPPTSAVAQNPANPSGLNPQYGRLSAADAANAQTKRVTQRGKTTRRNGHSATLKWRHIFAVRIISR